MKVDGVPPVVFPHQQRTTPKSQEFSIGTSSPKEEVEEESKQLAGKDSKLAPQELTHAVERLNKVMQAYNTEISFHVHEKSGELMVKVVNSADKSVIREIPPERVLDMVAYFKDVLGVMIDEFI